MAVSCDLSVKFLYRKTKKLRDWRKIAPYTTFLVFTGNQNFLGGELLQLGAGLKRGAMPLQLYR